MTARYGEAGSWEGRPRYEKRGRRSIRTRAPAASYRQLSALSQLHVPVHRRQADPAAALAQPGAEVLGIDPPGDGHRPVGLEAAVDSAQVDVGVDVAGELDR